MFKNSRFILYMVCTLLVIQWNVDYKRQHIVTTTTIHTKFVW